MKIIPTLEGGLSIEPESDIDWSVLETIHSDIGRPAHLAESLAGLMDEESEWDEWVVPELVEEFNGQGAYIEAAIQHGKKQSPPMIMIRPQDAEPWYGAVNQARLSLQARYRLDVVKEEQEFDKLPAEVGQAYFRDRFYASLQSLILEFVLDPEES